jgi:predicted Zn-dependent peptidase
VSRFQKAKLSNGLRIVFEEHPQSRAASFGLWVLTGSRDEPKQLAGVSHFLEHMVFKGTKTRSAFQIAKSLEELGGELNAFTSRENTCFHATVLKEDSKVALEVLVDLVSNMKFSPSDYVVEKSVILQEMAMSEDQPEELIFDEFLTRAYPKHPLGTPIIGTVETISRMKSQELIRYYKDRYSPANLILSVAGNLDFQDLVKQTDELFGKKTRPFSKVRRSPPRFKPFRFCKDKTGEQLHLLMGWPASSFKDKTRFDSFIVNTMLGGGMTSRLFQRVREKKGLVYSIYSTLNTFEDSGLIQVYAGCEPQHMKSVLTEIKKEIDKVKSRGISTSELKMFQRQICGSILMGSDDVENRMNSIAVNEVIFGEYRPVERVIEEIQAVTVKSVRTHFEEVIDDKKMGLCLLGAEAEAHREWVQKEFPL